MNYDTPSAPPSASDSLQARIERLEQDNKRLQGRGVMLLVAVALALGVTVALAIVSGRFGHGGAAEVLAARQFVLRAQDGSVRGIWGTDKDGTVRLLLQDAEGHARTKLTLLADGSAGLTFLDGAGHTRSAFALLPDQTASLVFADPSGNTRSVLGISPQGSANIVFADPAGVTRAGLGVDNEGGGTFTLVDRGGRELGQPEATAEEPTMDSTQAAPVAPSRAPHRR